MHTFLINISVFSFDVFYVYIHVRNKNQQDALFTFNLFQ
jgi:hypothetical protein